MRRRHPERARLWLPELLAAFAVLSGCGHAIEPGPVSNSFAPQPGAEATAADAGAMAPPDASPPLAPVGGQELSCEAEPLTDLNPNGDYGFERREVCMDNQGPIAAWGPSCSAGACSDAVAALDDQYRSSLGVRQGFGAILTTFDNGDCPVVYTDQLYQVAPDGTESLLDERGPVSTDVCADTGG